MTQKPLTLVLFEAIRDAYGYRNYLSMGQARALVPGVSRTDFDAAVNTLYRRPDFAAFIDTDDFNMSRQERDSAVRVGGSMMHLIRIISQDDLDSFDREDLADWFKADLGPLVEVPDETDRRERHADEALELEVKAAAKATNPLRTSLRALSVSALRDFLTGTRGIPLSKKLARQLRAIKPDVRSALSKDLGPAVLLGIRQGLEALGVTESVPRETVTDRYLTAQVQGVDEIALERLSEAADMAGKIALDERTELDLILAKANTALTGADWAVRWTTNRAISAGTSKVAAEYGARLVWVPERDACLHCLAYAGYVVEPGQSFPPGRTFADKPLKVYGDLLYPPLHPNCRCQVDITYLPVGLSDEPLVREAQRSVARGLSNYASEPAQLRAADRMLQSPTLLPRSVRERAQRNIAAGKFKTRPKPIS